MAHRCNATLVINYADDKIMTIFRGVGSKWLDTKPQYIIFAKLHESSTLVNNVNQQEKGSK